MNVLENILEEIKQYTKDVYECDLDDIVEYQRRNREDKCTYIVQGIEEATEFIRSHMDDEDNDGWISVEDGLPEDCEEIVLVQVSGKMAENIWFDNAFELATYVNGEGWILENYPECENPKVIAWQPLPEPYKPKKDITASGKEHIMSRFMKVE